jgi:hypothetical protein
MLNNLFNNPNTKKILTLACLVIIMALFGVYQCVDDYYNDNVVEGVINSNCCGGIQGGVHYQETDTRPPEYIRRCFRSRRDNSEVEYEWSGFPCSGADSAECCQNSDGTDLGQCVPTSKGGYCELNNNKKIFRRGKSSASGYIKRGNDKILDINNTVDMEDYFFDRDKNISREAISPDMKEFLNRRDRNSKFLQGHILDHNRDKIKGRTEAKLKASEGHKKIQIKSTILFVHLIFVIGFALLIKSLIVQKIDGFYGILSQKYLEFTGKTV